MNVQKGVEILGEAAGCESDGLVESLTMGVGRMVICETRSKVNSFNEQVLNYASSHQLFWLMGEWDNEKQIQSKLFLLWNYDNFGFQPNELP